MVSNNVNAVGSDVGSDIGSDMGRVVDRRPALRAHRA